MVEEKRSQGNGAEAEKDPEVQVVPDAVAQKARGLLFGRPQERCFKSQLCREAPLIYHPSEAGYVKLWSFVIPFRLISKSNDKGMARSGRHFKSAKFRAFEESVAFLAVATCKRPLLKEGWVVIEQHAKNRVHIDPSNSPKSVLDALVKACVFSDDKYVGVTVPAIPVFGDENSVVEIWGKKTEGE